MYGEAVFPFFETILFNRSMLKPSPHPWIHDQYPAFSLICMPHMCTDVPNSSHTLYSHVRCPNPDIVIITSRITRHICFYSGRPAAGTAMQKSTECKTHTVLLRTLTCPLSPCCYSKSDQPPVLMTGVFSFSRTQTYSPGPEQDLGS